MGLSCTGLNHSKASTNYKSSTGLKTSWDYICCFPNIGMYCAVKRKTSFRVRWDTPGPPSAHHRMRHSRHNYERCDALSYWAFLNRFISKCPKIDAAYRVWERYLQSKKFFVKKHYDFSFCELYPNIQTAVNVLAESSYRFFLNRRK